MKLQINQTRCTFCQVCVAQCPFQALTAHTQTKEIEVTAGCKMCRVCIKACPVQAITIVEDTVRKVVDKTAWNGIMVIAEQNAGILHPVSMELLGKATELASVNAMPVYAALLGKDIEENARQLLMYGANEVYAYDDSSLQAFHLLRYADAIEALLKQVKPSVVLVGATPLGRSLAPRLSTRFATGLTADCTALEMKENTDLVQIRPAFGGNIMARIITPFTRPQFATVRYKVMNALSPLQDIQMEAIHYMPLLDKHYPEMIVKEMRALPKSINISECDVLVVAGRGVKNKADLAMLEELAQLLGGQLAVTRPLVEQGFIDNSRQIGLSGRSVKPRLIIVAGVSGAVQFTAGMDSSTCIIAINEDKDAPIFRVAHYGIVNDLYEVIPAFIQNIKQGGMQHA